MLCPDALSLLLPRLKFDGPPSAFPIKILAADDRLSSRACLYFFSEDGMRHKNSRNTNTLTGSNKSDEGNRIGDRQMHGRCSTRSLGRDEQEADEN